MAFRDCDPNGNGVADEIPLAGSFDLWSKQSYNYIINAFIYNDPQSARLFVQDGNLGFAPITKQWREAMIYLNQLYEEGLLADYQFTLNSAQLSGLANDPGDLLGAFTSESITDVLLGNSQEILSKYVHVVPITGPDGVRFSTIDTPLPKFGGVILSSCENADAAFRLLDIMLSEDAFIISRYGEQNIDWETAKGTDMNVYGNRAVIRVLNPLNGIMQNKNFAGAGPFFAYPKYANGATWLGYDAEYFNGRAYWAYEKFQPPEHMGTILAHMRETQDFKAKNQRINDYVDKFQSTGDYRPCFGR